MQKYKEVIVFRFSMKLSQRILSSEKEKSPISKHFWTTTKTKQVI
jgi:hypothetical protein